MNTKSDQQIVKQDVMTMRYLAVFGNCIESPGCQTRLAPGLPHGSLATVSNQPVIKRRTRTCSSRPSLVTVTYCPVVKPTSSSSVVYASLVTRSNHPAAKTQIARADLKFQFGNRVEHRHSCFSDPGRKVSRPVRISPGVNSRSNSGTVCFSSHGICYPVDNICG